METIARTLRDLRRALIAGLVVPAVLFVAAAAYDRARLFHEAEEQAADQAAMLAEHTRTVLDTLDLMVRGLADTVRGQSWPQIEADRAPISATIRRLLSWRPDMTALALIEPSGEVSLGEARPGLPPPPRGVEPGDREALRALRDGGEAASVYLGATSVGRLPDQLAIGLARRREAPDGGFGGVVLATIEPGVFVDFLGDARRPAPGAAVSLLRPDGTLLLHVPGADALAPPLPATHPAWRDIARAPSGGVRLARAPAGGGRVVLAWHDVPGYPVRAVQAIRTEALLQAWYRHLGLLLVLALLAKAALTLVIRSAMRQTRALRLEHAQRLAAEAAAREAHRLEVIGQLAAGVAHDFRNVLTTVQGAASLLEQVGDDRTRRMAAAILRASERGTALVQGLMRLARRDAGAGEAAAETSFEPAAAVRETCQLLQATLGARWQLACRLADAAQLPARVRGARIELERALMNLVLNARDAMPEGGRIAVTLETQPDPPELPPGRYARLTVRDSGPGMPAEVLARAGTLFFTTKPPGQGTGLGLASARGFAERAGGALRIRSAPGQGSEIALWLPDAASTSPPPEAPAPA